ncbi:hypothetical protein C1Y08_15830 [Pseudomonas sp. FW306-02-F02-AA]|nr:hypothetical protein C1Y07_05140 [Pseudomonas sp. FW306-02-F02-AB]PMZ09238.1 hypothetical protein C1Y06_15080 [Pseudomonas sp. FW306-02-H06C]PMZ14950.1 hypothetical protein C1Y08_15830 [Pseudomonas sp. FW306-02-F02-AA]PMZ20137.1 hypothetical protein C1Y09_20065 [Pseudomonas sp. FW306-02-F08-AA]PMZ29533.1 hypothetical protein C1Y05_02970 [Pseudomonas sp. FW306-02-F04-BA]PMZ35745.1 hypothetical protein C1X99_05170 [Pseudomonas sp. FW306-02-H06B]PMZ42507.1 hypothetical protein C1Y00_00890 [Ps
MPPDGHRSKGTPSLGEVPYAWGEAFCLLFGVWKSESPSGRNPKRPLPQEWICTPARGWSAVRPPSRASPAPTVN